MLNLAIIGGGPNGLYSLNSILMLKKLYFKKIDIFIYIFDKNGNFGTGWAHSPFQSNTSMLNRISGQLSFSPDNFLCNLNFININFTNWCKKKFLLIRDVKYNKSADEFPVRNLYGESLKEIFNCIFQECLFKNIFIYLFKREIINILKNNLGLYKIIFNKFEFNISFNVIFISTGHQEIKYNFIISRKFNNIIQYINFIYPLFSIYKWMYKNIVVLGMGLTSIDLLLFYTENKDGYFFRLNNKLFYRASFYEPKNLFPLSRSGYFVYSRPHNFKEINLYIYEHNGFFLKKKFIDILRCRIGNRIGLFNSMLNHIKQIDFNINLFPFLLFELKISYYKILFGFEIISLIIFYSKKNIFNILNKKNIFYNNKDLLSNYLFYIIDKIILESIFKIKFFLKTNINLFIYNIPIFLIFKRFKVVIFGRNIKINKDICLYNLYKNIFNINYIINPISNINFSFNFNFKSQIMKFMELDRLQSEQGNLDNPYKGCCDDVFRDLRQVIVYSIDLGGINPSSYDYMLKDFYSIHNRAANGNCIELMEKIESLILSKIVNVIYSKSIIQLYNNKVYLHSYNNYKVIKKINIIMDAKLHNFNVLKTKNKLFKKILFNKIGSLWIYCDILKIRNNIFSFNLNKNFQLLNIYDERELIFCLGQPSEGIFFFQNGSIRPNVNHHVGYDLLLCLIRLQQELLYF